MFAPARIPKRKPFKSIEQVESISSAYQSQTERKLPKSKRNSHHLWNRQRNSFWKFQL